MYYNLDYATCPHWKQASNDKHVPNVRQENGNFICNRCGTKFSVKRFDFNKFKSGDMTEECLNAVINQWIFLSTQNELPGTGGITASYELRPDVEHLGHCERNCTECEMENNLCRYIGGTPGYQDDID